MFTWRRFDSFPINKWTSHNISGSHCAVVLSEVHKREARRQRREWGKLKIVLSRLEIVHRELNHSRIWCSIKYIYENELNWQSTKTRKKNQKWRKKKAKGKRPKRFSETWMNKWNWDGTSSPLLVFIFYVARNFLWGNFVVITQQQQQATYNRITFNGRDEKNTSENCITNFRWRMKIKEEW